MNRIRFFDPQNRSTPLLQWHTHPTPHHHHRHTLGSTYKEDGQVGRGLCERHDARRVCKREPQIENFFQIIYLLFNFFYIEKKFPS